MTDEVEQVDREAAAVFAGSAWHLFWPKNFDRAMQDVKDMRAGRCDNWGLVQAFKRHRLASTEALRAENERLQVGLAKQAEKITLAKEALEYAIGHFDAYTALGDDFCKSDNHSRRASFLREALSKLNA